MVVEIQTGCRIHFGLMELSPDAPMRFSGLGLSLSRPGFRMQFSADPSLIGKDTSSVDPEYLRRVDQVGCTEESDFPRIYVNLSEVLPLHSGLGAGTQLGAAVAAGREIYKEVQLGSLAAEDKWSPVGTTCGNWTVEYLSGLSGRGLRSAIGLQGLLNGGLVLDYGDSTEKAAGESRSFSCKSISVPDDWRVVLILPSVDRRMWGSEEAKLLADIGRRPNSSRDKMFMIAEQLMESVHMRESIEKFAAGLSEYMDLASKVFCEVQGGKYNGQDATRAVSMAVEAGLLAVGQSSWGPTIFGFAPSECVARSAVEKMQQDESTRAWKISIAKPDDCGATWRVVQ